MANWVQPDLLLPYIYVAATCLLTWLPALRCGFVSDDIEGVLKFSDRWDADKDVAIDCYDRGDGVKIGHRAFNGKIEFPGSIIRWMRLNLGARFQVIGKNKKGHEVYGYVQSPFKHHFVNIVLHLCNCLLAYAFLNRLFGPHIALSAVLLFTVHPLACQAVAWCSGIGYLLSLFGVLVSLNVALSFSSFLDLRILLPSVAASTLLSVSGMMAGAGTWIILWFLGLKSAAYAALVVAAYALFKQGRSIVQYRAAEFKKQQMGKSTYLTWRKPIVMVKTAYYYLKLIVFPKRLGLFHAWGYHFDEHLERVDGMFWKGLLSISGLIWFSLQGSLPVQFGLLWMLVYVAIFLNFITAQQFVADRYAFIPSLGYSVILAALLQSYPIVLAFIIGLYLMRTWAHIPTFDNDMKFYQSNIWNFPDSEVAYGNLGVIYANKQLSGAAADAWLIATNINPFYDVPHYNLYSMFKGGRQFKQAKEFLQRCLNAKVVHFPDIWHKEMAELDAMIVVDQKAQETNQRINDALNQKRYEDIPKIQAEFEEFVKKPQPPPDGNVK